MKMLLVVVVLLLGGCSNTFWDDGRIHCLNGYVYMVMNDQLVLGVDEGDEPLRCGK